MGRSGRRQGAIFSRACCRRLFAIFSAQTSAMAVFAACYDDASPLRMMICARMTAGRRIDRHVCISVAFQQRWLPLRRDRLPPPILLVQALAMPSGWLPMTSPTQPLHETSSYRISGVSPDHCHACNLRSFAAKMTASILRTTTPTYS